MLTHYHILYCTLLHQETRNIYAEILIPIFSDDGRSAAERRFQQAVKMDWGTKEVPTVVQNHQGRMFGAHLPLQV